MEQPPESHFQIRPVNADCRHYIGDRPCAPHKEDGVTCEDCPRYDPIRTRILLVKLGALGDVVRTAALVDPLLKAYPGAQLTWLTHQTSVPFLQAVPGIDRVMAVDCGTVEILRAETFDILIGLDLSDEATALAANCSAKQKLGFGRLPNGAVCAFDERGERILAMSHWDDLKRANRDTYQHLMCDLLGLPRHPYPIPDPVRPEAKEAIEQRFGAFPAAAARPWIGLNVGGGGRWPKKVWTSHGFAALAARIRNELHGTPLLFHGPDDAEKAEAILDYPGVPPFDTGGDLTVLEFAEFLSRCDAVVTGDTLGLHLALAVRTPRVICLVGPTSAAELELYGRGRILQGTVDCLGCYRTTCQLDPDCMNTIDPDAVWTALLEVLEGEGS